MTESTESPGREEGSGSEPSGSAWSSTLGRVRRGYAAAAVVLLNTVVLFLVLNLLLEAYYLGQAGVATLKESSRPTGYFRPDGAPIQNGRRSRREMEQVDYRAYKPESQAFVAQVLDDFYHLDERGFVYQPWVQFTESPFEGRLVHVDVDSMGFPMRRTIAAAADTGPDTAGDPLPTVRVFTLGGSTTFGDMVADRDTWPSRLSAVLNARARAARPPFRVEVSNYGHGYFYPTQETALLGDLLRSGHRPDLVIFMDGVNWSGPQDVPHYFREVSRGFSRSQFGRELTPGELRAYLSWLPMMRLAGSINDWLEGLPRSGRAANASSVTARAGWDTLWADYTVRRFEQSRRADSALCAVYACRALSFLQPSARYRYDLSLYRMKLPAEFVSQLAPYERFYRTMRCDSGYIDLSGLWEEFGSHRRAVVDYVHYSPQFAELVARRVADHIDFDRLRRSAASRSPARATGEPRPVLTRFGWIRPPIPPGPAPGEATVPDSGNGG